jgi:hypothetical protein
MKLGKIFICINILVLSLLLVNIIVLLKRRIFSILLQNDTPSQFKNRNSKTKMVFEILMAWENEFVKIFTLFPEIHAPVLSHFITLKHYS